MRSLSLPPAVQVRVRGNNRSLRHAQSRLTQLGVHVALSDSAAVGPLLLAGDGAQDKCDLKAEPYVVRLWDFQVGHRGTGLQAGAAAGVSCVLGFRDGKPLALPLEIPEQWCGLLGASLATAYYLQPSQSDGKSQLFDVSCAEILRSFADQNFANHKAYPESWNRNGRVTPSHGGIFPQGFFACADGHVAIVGRSKADWEMILAALGHPSWATGKFLDPVYLASHSDMVEPLFLAELARFSRDDLLDLAIRTGATFAPVYRPEEMKARNLLPEDLFDASGVAQAPFQFSPF
jgi:crotonobetainyl-CoA:carnitine CoA-transferase CaiB-like acyl-CoA transferase